MDIQKLLRRVVFAVLLAVAAMASRQAVAEMPVLGSLPFWELSSGYSGYIYRDGASSSSTKKVNNYGVAVGNSDNYQSTYYSQARPAMKWDVHGNVIIHQQFDYTDRQSDNIHAINDAGVSVGTTVQYEQGLILGTRPMRWDTNGKWTRMDTLTHHQSAKHDGIVRDINNAGFSVGESTLYSETSENLGSRPALWGTNGSITELGSLGHSSAGVTQGSALAINDAGAVVGYVEKYVGGVSQGTVAVKWNAGSTEAIQLGGEGTSARGINSAGIVVGNGYSRAYRWDADGTSTQLQPINAPRPNHVTTYAHAINELGDIAGRSGFEEGTRDRGTRATRWDAGSGTAIELAHLGTDSSGYTEALATSINDARVAVGWANTYSGNTMTGTRATVWLPDTTVIDLNTLDVISANESGTWVLSYVHALTADGYMTGGGMYDEDGAGPSQPYVRGWVGQLGLGGSWLNTTGSNNTWGKGRNWSTGTPAIQLDAVFDQQSTYTVAFDDNEQARAVTVSGGDVTLALGSRKLTVEQGVTVAAGAALRTNGTIEGDVFNHGLLSPGNSPGPLHVTGDFTSSGVLEMELVDTSSYDTLTVDGLFTLSGILKLSLLSSYVPQVGDTFALFDVNAFADAGYTLEVVGGPEGLELDLSELLTTGSITVTSVPEPSTVLLASLGAVAAACGVYRRRRRA